MILRASKANRSISAGSVARFFDRAARLWYNPASCAKIP